MAGSLASKVVLQRPGNPTRARPAYRSELKPVCMARSAVQLWPEPCMARSLASS